MIKFCIPLILSGILQQLYNWADAFIVGNVAGENALAAIGSTTTIINLFLTAITGFTLGLSILFAQKFGAGKKDQISKTLSVFTVVLGCAFLLVPAAGIPGAYPLLRTMNTTPETIHMAKNYLQIILIGIPFLAVYNVYTSALRGIGNSRAPFGSVLCSSVVNVVLGTGGYLISMFGISPESTEIGKISSKELRRFMWFTASPCPSGVIQKYTEGIGDVLFSSISGIAALVSRIIFSYAFAGLCGNMIIAYAEAGSWGVLFFLYLIRILWRQKTGIPPQKAFSKS